MNNEITRLRKEINVIDEGILSLILERTNIARKIGDIKKSNSFEIKDESRESKIISKWKGTATTLSLDTNLIEKIAKTVIELCRRIQ